MKTRLFFELVVALILFIIIGLVCLECIEGRKKVKKLINQIELLTEEKILFEKVQENIVHQIVLKP